MILALLLVLQTPVPLDQRIDQLYEDCRTADVNSLKKLVARHKHDRSVVPEYFEFALKRVQDPEARSWVATGLIKTAKGPLLLGCIEAIRTWKYEAARKDLHAMLRKAMTSRKRDHARILALAKALGDTPAFEPLARESDWRIQLAAAHCLPKKLHPAAAGIFLNKHASVLEAACARAGGAYSIELDELARSGVTRASEAAAAGLRRLSKSVPERAKDRLPDTVHFVLDVSGQMKWPDTSPNRMQVAVLELRKRIQKLDRTTRFNLFTFAGHVAQWKKRPIVATQDAKMRAIAWIDANALPRGATNTMTALGFHRTADEVVYISGSLPSTGKHTHPAEILIKFHDWNRFARTRVHTVAVTLHDGKAAQKTERFMKRLAEWTGGTHQVFRKPFRDGR